MKEYAWKQLSQWDVPDAKYYIQYRKVRTGLSGAICAFLLIEKIILPDGYVRTEPVLKTEVTSEILEIAEET